MDTFRGMKLLFIDKESYMASTINIKVRRASSSSSSIWTFSPIFFCKGWFRSDSLLLRQRDSKAQYRKTEDNRNRQDEILTTGKGTGAIGESEGNSPVCGFFKIFCFYFVFKKNPIWFQVIKLNWKKQTKSSSPKTPNRKKNDAGNGKACLASKNAAYLSQTCWGLLLAIRRQSVIRTLCACSEWFQIWFAGKISKKNGIHKNLVAFWLKK